MNLYEMITSIKSTEIPLFLLILLLAISVLIAVRYLLNISAPYFFLGILGIILGLIIGSIASAPLTRLPGSIGVWFPPILNIFITVAILDLFLAQGKALFEYFFPLIKNSHIKDNLIFSKSYVVDSSIMIDGRILKMIESGFLDGTMIISNLVIKELKRLGDEKKSLKKVRGQRGLDILSEMQKSSKVNVIIENQGFQRSVDDALVFLAKQKNAELLTCDTALAKVAQISNVKTVNLHQLVDSLKPILLPGEEFEIFLHQEGRSNNQAVGYLDDGTMVVVSEGKAKINQKISVRVEKIHQTTSGTIIFATFANQNDVLGKEMV